MVTECYVVAHYDYEGMTIAGVYESNTDAESALASVRAYCAGAPHMPGLEEPDDVFERLEREYKKWCKGHPFGEVLAYHRDDFHIATYPYHPKTTP